MASFKLSLRNWGQHVQIDLDLRCPVTIVTGQNACGKTAIVDAIEFVYLGTGRIRGITTQRDLGAFSISYGAVETAVTLETDALTICRSMRRDGSQEITVNGHTLKRQAAQAKIEEALGMDSAQVRAALNAEDLLKADEKVRRSVLLGSIGAKATEVELLEAFGRKAIAVDHADGALVVTMIGDHGFDAAEAYAGVQRAAKTRELQAAPEKEPQAIFSPSWAERTWNLAETKLATIRAREAELQTMLNDAHQTAGELRGEIQARLKALEREHDERVADRERLEAAQGNREALASEIDGCSDELENLEAVHETLDAAAKRHRDLMLAVDTGCEKPDICPVIPGGFACPAPRTKLDVHAKEVAKKFQEGEKALPDRLVAYQENRDSIAATTRQRDEARLELEKVDSRHAQLDYIQARLDTLETEITGQKTALDGVPRGATEDDSRAFVQGRLEKCQKLRAAKEAFDRDLESYRRYATTRGELEVSRLWWDSIAQACKATGIPAELLAKRIGPVAGYAEELGKVFGSVRVAEDGAVELQEGDQWLSFVQLSESYRQRMAMVASHVLGRLTGFPLLIVDRFDHLDGRGRVAAINGLVGVSRFYSGGVLVLATLSPGRPKPTAAEDDRIETVWLHDGVAQVIS